MTAHSDDPDKTRQRSVETDVASGLHFTDSRTGAVVPSIEPSTTFARSASYELLSPDHSYARDQNPSFVMAERMLCRLEGGADALLFASGMAAAMAVVQTLRPGDHIVAPQVMYWGLRGWLKTFCAQWDIAISFFDSRSADGLQRALRPGSTRLVWIETPCNPTWEVIDIAASAAAAHEVGAKLVVDSTAATPVLTRPLELGADIVMHSATKYLNGHGDVVAGALVGRNDDEMWQALRDVRANGGAILGSFEAWLLQRGMRTLFLRVQRAAESAAAIADHFANDPRVAAVLYPGLPDHPGHDVAARQMRGGFGGMLSLRVNGGREVALATAARCEVFVRATSLGGVESLIEHRRSIEGDDSPIPEDLLRLSVGIESKDDLIADLDRALGETN